jgi:hypothetical protein
MLIMLIFLVSTASPAFCSENFDFVIIQPGQPGTSEDAQPVMDALATYLQKKLGADVTIRGRYFNQAEQAAAYLAGNRPQWGIVGLGYYLGHAGDLCMTPLASTRPGGSDSDTWRLVVAKNGPDKWQTVKGVVSGTMLFEPGIAAGLLFDSSVAELPFSLEGTIRPLSALRSVLRGKGGAVVLDKPQYDAVQALPMASGVKVLKTSRSLPTSAVVVFGPKKKLHERLSSVLREMRKDPAAADLLKLLQTEGFGPVDKRLDALKEKNA